MRISEKMGLVYTALFLTVSVAVITQNEDRLMAAFRGESAVLAVDDVFTVQTGMDQHLPVLQNDVSAAAVRPDLIHVTAAPSCGSVRKIGTSFVYRGASECVGHQSFSYCLDTGRSCKPAIVALRLIAARAPVDTIRTGPITDLAGLDAQVGINGHDLEITNVHLGTTAPKEDTTAPMLASKLAKTAVETLPNFTPPAPLSDAIRVNAVFDMPGKMPAKSGKKALREASSTPAMLTDGTPPTQNANAVALPKAPGATTPALLPSLALSTFSLRAAAGDTGFRTPTVMPGIDQSPFGTPCKTTLSASPRPGALVDIALNAPCHPNSTVEIRHGKMRIRLKTDHIGKLKTRLPALETHARFQIRIADRTPLTTEVFVPDLERMDRIVIQWRGTWLARLQPLRADGRPQANITVLTGNNMARAVHDPRGFIMLLGDSSIEGPELAAVYSRPHQLNPATRVVSFSVAVTPSLTSCGKSGVIQSFRSRAGRLVAASGLQFKMPGCDGKTRSIVLKNAVRDLMIATN